MEQAVSDGLLFHSEGTMSGKAMAKKRSGPERHAAAIFGYLRVFLMTAAILISCLLAVTQIPREWVQGNLESSARLLSEQDFYYNLEASVDSTKIDHFADSVLMSIVWYQDGKHPVRSVLRSDYYYASGNIGNSLLKTVTENPPANREYLRYWHGSAIPVRLLHLFGNIRQIWLFHAAVLIALLLLLLAVLWRGGFRLEAASVLISLAAVSSWVVPFCLEYYWVFLLMLLCSVWGVRFALKERYDLCGSLFLVCGTCTSFFDFLTTETLTLLIPLLLIIRIRSLSDCFEKEDAGKRWCFLMKQAFLWLAGYCLMWSSKWLLSSIALKQNVLPDIFRHIEERTAGIGSTGLPLSRYLTETFRRNTGLLVPLNRGIGNGLLLMAVVLIILEGTLLWRYLCVKRRADAGRILPYLALGCLPYCRFLLLHNHSYVHYFFTYRAQAATVLAVCLIILEILQKDALPRKRRTDIKDKAGVRP